MNQQQLFANQALLYLNIDNYLHMVRAGFEKGMCFPAPLVLFTVA